VLIFRERGRARSWHESLYRQRLRSGVPVMIIWILTGELQALRAKLLQELAKVASTSLACRAIESALGQKATHVIGRLKVWFWLPWRLLEACGY
jgi:hypothetical protein